MKVNPQDTWDFDYTVNRRRASRSNGGLIINRLAKWSLGQELLGEEFSAAIEDAGLGSLLYE